MSVCESLVAASDEAEDKKKWCKCQKTEEESIGYDTRWIGCEGDNCKYERFHYKCVGLRRKPKHSWICEDCQQKPSD